MDNNMTVKEAEISKIARSIMEDRIRINFEDKLILALSKEFSSSFSKGRIESVIHDAVRNVIEAHIEKYSIRDFVRMANDKR